MISQLAVECWLQLQIYTKMVGTLDVGGGLVEIAALTSLIGATTAENLVLGSRGPAGLPWATMSTFGSVFLIKACIAACTPGWLRDTVGVRNNRCDAAVGLAYRLGLSVKPDMPVGDAAGVAVHLLKVGKAIEADCLAFCIESNTWTAPRQRRRTIQQRQDVDEHVAACFH